MTILRVFAVLFALLAVSNFMKPLEMSGDQGFVFMGRRLSGTPNLIAGWSFGVFLLWYAWSLWKEKASALPIGIAYASYVTANLYLFLIRAPTPEGNAAIFGMVYTVVALTMSWGCVVAMLKAGYASRDAAPGRVLMRAFALLFAWMALSNTLKPFAYEVGTGFVLFGHRLAGTPNVVAALVFAAVLAAYAASIWNEKAIALKLGIAYAGYVLANLILWNFYKPDGADVPILFAIPYLASAIGVSSGSAYLLWRNRERLA